MVYVCWRIINFLSAGHDFSGVIEHDNYSLLSIDSFFSHTHTNNVKEILNGHSYYSDLLCFVEYTFTYSKRGTDKGFCDLQSSNDDNWGPGEGFQETTQLTLFK